MADVKICDKCERVITGLEAGDKAVFALWWGNQLDLCGACASQFRQVMKWWLRGDYAQLKKAQFQFGLCNEATIRSHAEKLKAMP
jgi:hypothetical protein